MEWGERASWLQEVHDEEGGPPPKALVDRPDIPEHLAFAYGAFWELSGDRALGFGAVGPITFVAIDAYAARHGVDDPDSFTRFAGLIRVLDGAWRKAQEKPKEGG